MERLQRIGLELVEFDEEAICEVYGTAAFVDWREDTLPYIRQDRQCHLSPDEEVDDFLRRFQLRKPLTDVARLMPTEKGVWEVRLQQMRLFGWFPEFGVMVLSSGDKASVVKSENGDGYAGHFRDVLKVRTELGIGYVAGDLRKVLPKR